jgi:tRNA threonylcarbamoyladenosine biosynthesis protein TsaB
MEDGMNHTALLAPAIKQLLDAASLVPGDLDAIAVSSGPGSYTGLRVGNSTAKAMAYSLGIPVIAVPTLLALASAAFEGYPEARYAMPMIDARRKEVYSILYDRTMKEVWPVSSVILNEYFFETGIPKQGQIICCGDGSLKIGELGFKATNLMIDTSIQCSARHLIQPAIERKSKGIFEDPLHFVPYYHKPPNITEPKKPAFTPL